jgi:hypothetical protein
MGDRGLNLDRPTLGFLVSGRRQEPAGSQPVLHGGAIRTSHDPEAFMAMNNDQEITRPIRRATPGSRAHALRGRRQLPSRYRFHRPPKARVVLCAGNAPVRVVVRDWSPRGVNLLCHRSMEPGTRLVLQLPNFATGYPRTGRVKVRAASAQPGAVWLLRCRFTWPLSAAVVAKLLDTDRQWAAEQAARAQERPPKGPRRNPGSSKTPCERPVKPPKP